MRKSGSKFVWTAAATAVLLMTVAAVMSAGDIDVAAPGRTGADDANAPIAVTRTPLVNQAFQSEASEPDPDRLSLLVYMTPRSEDPLRASEARVQVRAFAQREGGRVHYEYELLPDVVNLRDIPRLKVNELEGLPGVVKVIEDYEVRINLHDSTPLINALQSQIQGAGLSADGAGVRICVADTGIDSDHIMYATQIDTAAGFDFVNNDPNPEDDQGHGSHCSGIALGRTGLTVDFGCVGPEPFQGVAPGATLIGVKVLNSQGSGSASDIAAGINHCASTSLPGGQADVISLSLGGGQFSGTCDGDFIAQASNAAVNAGVFVVAASGNDGFSNSMGTPACGSQVFSVGAVYDDTFPSCEDPTNSFTWCLNQFCTVTCTDNMPQEDDLVCFSNASVNLDVTAPGCVIYSANYLNPNGITTQCGTSQATPHVAGLAALLLDADPSLTPAQVGQAIRDGASDLGPAGFDNEYGWGRVDAIASLQLVSGCTVDNDCDDGLFCNGAETCNAGSCQAGTAPNCDDGVGCTNDSCNEGTDSCDNTPVNANCDNGQFCDGAETCDAINDCQAGSAPDCTDGVGCTDDSCNEGTDRCDNVANDANCDNGQFCDGAETCDAINDCQAGSDPCPGQTCDEVGDVCLDCSVDADCDDGAFCNGAETCNAGTCQAGTAPVCDDGVGCTNDSCNEGTDSCDNIPADGNCDDGAFCNGAETCDAINDCQAGSAVDCTDGVSCTADSCNEGTDSCDNTPVDALCGNGAFCDGAETCNAVLDCQAGTPVNCDDGVGCTIDSCNEGADTCDNVTDDGACDDGQFCNGAETCDAVNDCQAGSDPCPGQSCNESSDVCESISSGARMETGTVTVGGTHVTVALTNTYVSPVVACSVQYANNTTPVVARVRNASSTSFEVRLQNPSDGAVAAENVNYIVVEEGTWTIDGLNIEAQTYTSTLTDQNNSWVGQAQAYGQTYANPVVLGQVMTENDPDWSVFWDRGSSRTNPPSATTLFTGKTVCEDTDTTRANETVGFIVMEAGSGTIGGVAYNVALGPDNVAGVTNSPPYSNTFASAFAGAPQVVVTTQAAMDGVNGGWAQTHGSPQASSTTVFLSIDEDQVGDSERSHTTEQVAHAAFQSAFAFEDGPGCVVDADCDDGLFCNGAETCNAGSCQAGTAPNCDDGVGCTADSCNEGTDSCDNTANDAACDNGLYCDGAETCDAINDCQSGTPPVCDDGVGCTVDSCNEGTDTCDNTANDSLCDNGVFCDGAETCDAVNDCQAATPLTCDDGVGCTTDSCNEAADTCDNAPVNSVCDNGLFCDGAETCDAVNDCQAGTPPVCDDGVGCTVDSCNEGTDSCDNTPDDGACDDGAFCNGAETCDAVNDCQAGSDPCPGQSCNEATDTCQTGPVAQMETGSLSVGATAVTVNLNHTYVNPVIVATVQYSNNTAPVVTRISGITATSFDVRLQRAAAGTPVADNVNYIVVEEGTWTIDGVAIEAQTYTSTVTDQNNSWGGQAQAYNQSYTNPVVLGQVMSFNDADWSVFWDQGASRGSPPSATVLRTGKTVCEDTDTTRANETIGFIVIEAGSGTLGGVAYAAALGADTIRGAGDSPPYAYSFGSAFSTTPAVAVTTMAAVDGGNGGWAQTHGATQASTTQLFLSIDEDTIGDSERRHTTEQVGYFVSETQISIP